MRQSSEISESRTNPWRLTVEWTFCSFDWYVLCFVTDGQNPYQLKRPPSSVERIVCEQHWVLHWLRVRVLMRQTRSRQTKWLRLLVALPNTEHRNTCDASAIPKRKKSRNGHRETGIFTIHIFFLLSLRWEKCNFALSLNFYFSFSSGSASVAH